MPYIYTDTRPLKAYRVTVNGWSDFEMIYPGTTRGKAKSYAYWSSDLAGFSAPFTEFRARRAPEFDELVQEAVGKMPWCFGWKDGGESWGCLKGAT